MDRHQLALLKLAESADKAPADVTTFVSLPNAVVPSDDGYHFPRYSSGAANEWYLEWWYFNFRDPVSGLAGILMYEVLNPDNELGLGRSGISLVVFSGDGQPLVAQELYPLTAFQASEQRAEVRIGPDNRIDQSEGDVHRVVMATENGEARVDLTYTRTSPGAFMSSDMSGPFKWENASWLCYTPQARVRGTVTLRGRSFTLERAVGYHDHNWGKWLLPARTFVWAAFSDADRGTHFNYGLSRGFRPGNQALLRVDGLDLVFPPGRIEEPQPHDFKRFDGLLHIWKYPTRVEISMIDSTDQYRLEMEWRVLETANLPRSPLVIFEHRARMHGNLRQRQGDGWKKVATLDGEGFCEWTDTWIPLPSAI